MIIIILPIASAAPSPATAESVNSTVRRESNRPCESERDYKSVCVRERKRGSDEYRHVA